MAHQDFELTIATVTEALKQEGFGIVTEIDMKDTLQKKLSVDFRKYKILGACHPSIALMVLNLAPKMGVFMPCNVVVEENEQGKVEVTIVDPYNAMNAFNNEALTLIAKEVQQKLQNVMSSL